MTSKKKRSLSAIILDMVMLIPNLMNVVQHTTTLIKSEARLAIKNIVMLVMLGIISALLLVSTWLGILAMLFIYLVSLHLSEMIALMFVLLINILFFMIVLLLLKKRQSHFLSRDCRQEFCEHCKHQ